MGIDPITLGVISNRLEEIQRVMKDLLFHTGYSTILRESCDGSASITDKEGRLIVSSGISAHAILYSYIVKAILKDFDVTTDIFPNDSFITNDPYRSGLTHVQDMAAVTPAIVSGKLIAFCGSIAHKTDIGGLVPGTGSPNSRSIFHEGLVIPPVKLYEEGKLNRAIQQILQNNSRTPKLFMGDLNGQVGSTRIGCQMLAKLCEEYSTDIIETAIEALMIASEKRVRHELSLMPDGEGEGENWLDNDVNDPNRPVRIHVKVVKKGDSITFDFSASDPQTIGPMNIRRSVVESVTIFALVSFLDSTIIVNEGVRWPVNFIIPEGLVVNPEYPAPVNHYFPSAHLVHNSVFRALSKFDSRKAIGDSGLGMGALSLGFKQTRVGGNYVMYEIIMTALGGNSLRDGTSMWLPVTNHISIQPIEIVENEFPLEINNFGPRQDSAGAGRWRGGLGYYREYKVLEDCVFTVRSSQHRYGSQGVFGGKSPKLSRVIYNPGRSDEREVDAVETINMRAGDIIRVERAGGGGYGNPFDRDELIVLNDVLNGYVSIESAKKDYGVVIDPSKGKLSIDEKATGELRKEGILIQL